MWNFFDEPGRTRIYEEAYLKYVDDVNSRESAGGGLIGKRAI